MGCRYAQVLGQMVKEIEKVNPKKGPTVGVMVGALLDVALGGHGESSIYRRFGAGGQKPQLSSSENFDLNLPMML